MALLLPVRRFLQDSEKTETPSIRWGVTQWVLTRPLYRFQTFDLAQMPANNRMQALRLALAQWTPFPVSAYYIGWHGQLALVWGWDADKVNPAIAKQGLNPQRVRILPETTLQTPLADGLSITRCQEGYEGQYWHEHQLMRSRWWPHSPSQDEWLMFQRDAGIPHGAQQSQPPAPRANEMNARPWINESPTTGDARQLERLVYALCLLLLLVPSLWYGISLYKLQRSMEQLQEQKTRLMRDADPIIQAHNQALDHLARIEALHRLSPYPEQLALMAAIAEILPADTSQIKEWDYRHGQLKFTLAAPNDIAVSHLIGILQQAGPFNEVKALPGRDPKSITLQMDVIAKRT